MPNTVVFLWVSAVTLQGPLASQATLVLRDFGAAQGLTFVSVAEAPRRPSGSPDAPGAIASSDAALVDLLEAELEQARTALSALEEVGASARLRKVETALLAHPHLPQAPFLMAECLALQAQAARVPAPEIAAYLDAQRFALEGPRAIAFGDAPARAPAAAVWLSVRGLDGVDALELDGARALHTERVSVVPGLHHVRVWRGDRMVFASFTSIAPEQTELVVDAPKLVPCSSEDLERASVDGEPAASVPKRIACARWARVRVEGSGIGVSLCQHSSCGVFRHWERRAPAPFAPIAISERRRWPAWAGFVLASGAVLATSSLVLWQAGAFDRDRSSAAGWRFGGLNP